MNARARRNEWNDRPISSTKKREVMRPPAESSNGSEAIEDPGIDEKLSERFTCTSEASGVFIYSQRARRGAPEVARGSGD